MTEFEMAYLFNDIQIGILAQLSLLVSVLSGYLVMSFVVAHRLSRTMMVLTVGIYSWFSWVFLIIGHREMAIYAGMMDQMRTFKSTGKGLNWHVVADYPPSFTAGIPVYWAVFQAFVSIAALAFFFHCRRVNGKAAAPASASA